MAKYPFVSNLRKKRSWYMRLLLLYLLILSWFGWLRFQQSLADWSLLVRYAVHPGPMYLAVSGAAWGIMGLIAFASLLLEWRSAAWITAASAVVYAGSYWVDRLALANSQVGSANLPFALLITVLGLGYAFEVLWTELDFRPHPIVNVILEEGHERSGD